MRRALAVLLVAAAACSGKTPEPTPPPGGALMRFGDKALAVEVADSAPEWQKGLGGRKSLAADHGMLFRFHPAYAEPVTIPFWMKDTLIPLSIAYLTQQDATHFTVLQALEMTPCPKKLGDNCHLYRPKAPYDAAVEANEGWFGEVKPGTKVILSR